MTNVCAPASVATAGGNEDESWRAPRMPRDPARQRRPHGADASVGTVRRGSARACAGARATRSQAGLRARQSWPPAFPSRALSRRHDSGVLGGPHSPTVAGAAAGWRATKSRAAPHSRFTRREGFAADTCVEEFYRFRRSDRDTLSGVVEHFAVPCYNPPPFQRLPPPPDNHRPRGAPVTHKLYIRTFGCQMNEYDSDKMADVLAADGGFALTDRPENADVILFNTCSVREKAQERVFHDLGRVRALKADKPDLIIGVGGCVASQEGADIVGRAPYVDVVFGPQTLHRLPALIRARRATGDAAGRHQLSGDREIRSPAAAAGRGRVGVRVDHGRLQQVLHVLRRALHARRGSLAPVRRRADRSGRSRRSGRDGSHAAGAERERVSRRRWEPRGEIADLATLLEYIAEVPGIERIRYTTSHPKEMSPRLIAAHGRIGKLVSHLHLPVQSGSDRVLAAMKRGYTALEYKSIVRKLRAVRPDLSLTSDFIVGFPGETDADFAQTMQLVEDVDFDGAFSFAYSPRPGTPAADVRRPGAARTCSRRGSQRCRRGSTRSIARYSEAMVGTRQRVLVTGPRGQGRERACGPDRQQSRRQFRGRRDARSARYVDVTITAARAHSLRGEFAGAR